VSSVLQSNGRVDFINGKPEGAEKVEEEILFRTSRFVTEPRYSRVLAFSNCQN
jgi:hypothetical protein